MVFTVNIRKLVSLIIGCLWMGIGNIVHAQETSDIPITNPGAASDQDYILKIEEGWDHQGRPLSIPFRLEMLDEATVSNQFELQDSVSYPLYLYIERASWDVEVELNGHYLGLSQKPFNPFFLPLDREWLKRGQNQIRITLSRGESCYLYPRHLLGIYEPVYLINDHQMADLQKPVMKTVETADTVAVVAPYYRTNGYAFDLFEACRTLLPLIKHPHKYIYFPFEPDRQMKLLCKKLGFVRVKNISDETVIGLINFYPYEAAHFPWTYSFWIDGNGRRTPAYRNFRPADEYIRELNLDENHNLIILLTFFPLISFVILKLLGAGFFESQSALLFNPKLYIDASLNTSDTQQGWLLILQFFRMAGLVIAVSLFIYYIRVTHQWDLIDLFRETSMLKEFFYQATSLTEILFRSFLIVLVWFLIKHLLILLIGGAFRIKGMLEGVMNLDILGSYPLVVLLPVPASLLLFWGDQNPYLMLGFLIVWVMVYLVRKLYIIFLGLNRLFGFPTTMKFLYICTFNIFPYMFWL